MYSYVEHAVLLTKEGNKSKTQRIFRRIFGINLTGGHFKALLSFSHIYISRSDILAFGGGLIEARGSRLS